MRTVSLAAACCLSVATAAASAQTAAPPGSLQNPRQVTAADRGPAVDPAKVAASPYNGLPLFRTFRSFTSNCYALADVWVCAAHDDPAVYDRNVGYDFPTFYRPTWGEVFDHVARQARCRWSFDPADRQFRFEPTDADPGYGVTLPAGWRREDRGLYVWHAPADQPFGLDVYEFGHYMPDPARPDLADQVRAYFALRDVSRWPHPPTLAQMTTVKVAGADALYLRADTPRPGGLWRQWSVVVDGHAFLIVSAMPKDREPTLGPAVDRMVASFAVHPPAATAPATTAPATAPAR